MAEDFKKLWDLQLRFNDVFFKKKLGKPTSELTMEEKVTWTKNHLLSIVKEAMEVLDEIPSWKEHRNISSEFIESNLLEEIIDVNKFAIGLAQIWGMTQEQYADEFVRKSYVVEQRWNQEQELKLIDPNAKIVGIDIDGVLGDYPAWYLKFLENKGYKFSTIGEAKEALGLKKYEELKSEYRQSGWKAKMPANPYASELTQALKELGYTIIILTARPYQKYSRIYPDTLQFLEDNKIRFDAIIWDEQKHLKIIKEFPKLQFMIEDNAHIAYNVANEGYKVFLKLPEEDKVKALPISHENIVLIDSLKDVLNYI
jgi:phosphoglycolate phosphatase-like HAD superfamily hydrolase